MQDEAKRLADQKYGTPIPPKPKPRTSRPIDPIAEAKRSVQVWADQWGVTVENMKINYSPAGGWDNSSWGESVTVDVTVDGIPFKLAPTPNGCLIGTVELDGVIHTDIQTKEDLGKKLREAEGFQYPDS